MQHNVSRQRRRRRPRRTSVVPLTIIFFGMTLTMFFGLRMLDGVLSQAVARWEYAELRIVSQIQETTLVTEEDNRLRYATLRGSLVEAESFALGDFSTVQKETPTIPPIARTYTVPTDLLLDINPDFVGWITIDGTVVDYPVVQGSDNETYLSATFKGTNNPAGAIFMDYHVKNTFDAPLVILYGNNMSDGTMFASLNNFSDADFLDGNREIRIITAQNKVLSYYIIGTIITDVQDDAYTPKFASNGKVSEHFGPSPGNGRLLVLSTLTSSRGRSERLLVYARLRA